MDSIIFECCVVAYEKTQRPYLYKKDSLKANHGLKIPVCWEHNHYDLCFVLGRATLIHKDDGLYVRGSIDSALYNKDIESFINDRTVFLSPYIVNIKRNGAEITYGIVREVSLVRHRIDPDDVYRPVIKDA